MLTNVAKRRVNTMIELVVNSLLTNVRLCTQHAKQVSYFYLYTTNLLLAKVVVVADVDVDYGRVLLSLAGYEVRHQCL